MLMLLCPSAELWHASVLGGTRLHALWLVQALHCLWISTCTYKDIHDGYKTHHEPRLCNRQRQLHWLQQLRCCSRVLATCTRLSTGWHRQSSIIFKILAFCLQQKHAFIKMLLVGKCGMFGKCHTCWLHLVTTRVQVCFLICMHLSTTSTHAQRLVCALVPLGKSLVHNTDLLRSC